MQLKVTTNDSCSCCPCLPYFLAQQKNGALYTNQTTVRIGKIKVTVVTKLIIC